MKRPSRIKCIFREMVNVILKEIDIDPSPQCEKGMWNEYLKMHADTCTWNPGAAGHPPHMDFTVRIRGGQRYRDSVSQCRTNNAARYASDRELGILKFAGNGLSMTACRRN
ncbi:MAG: hypothetical protein WKF77_03775 [Planctomycetaceae bacterium]